MITRKIALIMLMSLTIVFIGSNTADASSISTKNKSILEVVIFKVNKAVTPNSVRILALSLTSTLSKYPGFISREFAKNIQGEGQYIDIVKWKSLKDANYAAKNIIKNKNMRRFIAAMQYFKMYHFKLIYEKRGLRRRKF